MENVNQRSIDILNSLIEINNDRLDGYEHATQDSKEADLKTMFSQLSETSRNIKKELSAEVKKMGGTPKEGISISGKVYCSWIEIKTAMTKKKRKTILDCCEFVENIMVSAYREIVDADSIPCLSDFLKRQYTAIEKDYVKVRYFKSEPVGV